MANYTVGDFLIRFKNAALAGASEFEYDSVGSVRAVAKTLKKMGYFDSVKEEKGKLTLIIARHRKSPRLKELKLVSKPGLRVYAKSRKLAQKRGAARFIVSTPAGVMSSDEAIKKSLGGEVIVEVW